MTKLVFVFANNMYFAFVQWELLYLIFFWNKQWSVRQKSWPSKVSLFLGNRDVWNGGKSALEVQAREIDEMEKRKEGGE